MAANADNDLEVGLLCTKLTQWYNSNLVPLCTRDNVIHTFSLRMYTQRSGKFVTISVTAVAATTANSLTHIILVY